MKSLRARIITLLVMVGFSVWQLYARGLDLGLDLAGGSHLLLALADSGAALAPEQRADALERSRAVLLARARELGVQEPVVQRVGSDRIVVDLSGVADSARARGVVSRTGHLQFKLLRPTSEVEQALPAMERAVQARSAPPAADPAAASVDSAAVAMPAPDSAPAASAPTPPRTPQRSLRALLVPGDQPGTFLVSTDDVQAVRSLLAEPDVTRATPRTVSLQWSTDVVAQGARTYRRLYVLEAEPLLDAPALATASAQREPEREQSQVSYQLTSGASRAFEDATAASGGQTYAIVLDGEVVSTSLVQGRLGNRAVIDLGSAPLEDARALAMVLRAGPLPAPLAVVEDQPVGPAVGRASAGRLYLAAGLGLLLVAVLLVGYYRAAGVLAVAGLVLFAVLLLGGLAALDYTVTLAGVAGIVLALAIAVDGSVLVFERIREAPGGGRAARAAVDDGFARALWSVLDSHAVALIPALILYQLGSGAARGFALALSIGVLAATFSALFAARTLFTLYLNRRKPSDPLRI
jgi:preprotein translocase subunit SecD